MANYLREIQGGVVMEEAKVTANADYCQCVNKANKWVAITGEGNWVYPTGLSLLTRSGRKGFADAVADASKDAAKDLVEQCPE